MIAPEKNLLRVLDIVPGTTVDGPGLRTTIYFAGCGHHCPGCHNPESWDMAGGVPMEVDRIMQVITDNDFDVTFSGGDPFFQPVGPLTELARRVRQAGYTLWCYTGYKLEALRQKPQFSPLLTHVNVLVDGPFVQDKRNIKLRFRGSDNQRIITLNE